MVNFFNNYVMRHQLLDVEFQLSVLEVCLDRGSLRQVSAEEMLAQGIEQVLL